jgi:hypothetical protein
VQNNPNDDEYDCNKGQTDAQTYERRFLPAFDGGDDRRAALRTNPRMVADLSAAFVAFDAGHNSKCWLGFIWFFHFINHLRPKIV